MKHPEIYRIRDELYFHIKWMLVFNSYSNYLVGMYTFSVGKVEMNIYSVIQGNKTVNGYQFASAFHVLFF